MKIINNEKLKKPNYKIDKLDYPNIQNIKHDLVKLFVVQFNLATSIDVLRSYD